MRPRLYDRTTVCDWCGTTYERYPGRQKGLKAFCNNQCRKEWLSQNNAERNKTLMTPEVKVKLRMSRLGTGKGRTYTKTFGRHTHRIVAEEKLGRELLPGEVVHHINSNRRDNRPENLEIFSSQAEHVKTHFKREVSR